MTETQTKLPNTLGLVLIAIAAALYLTNIIFLFAPTLFDFGFANIGVVFYSLATAGAGFAAWGMIMKDMGAEGITIAKILKASAAGFILLGFMRLLTAFMPPPAFENVMPVLIGEFIVFTGIGIKLFRS